MKIAFIGTHGTGKTTLAHELVAQLKKKGTDAGLNTGVARLCPFPIKEDTTKKAQIWIILNQIAREMEDEEKFDVVICDRSAFDGYCYYTSKFGRFDVIENLVREHLKTYDYLIRIPIREGYLKKDKIRSANTEFQNRIDKEFDIMLKEMNVDYIVLTPKTIKNLVSQI